jgi:hypothetical protein
MDTSVFAPPQRSSSHPALSLDRAVVWLVVRPFKVPVQPSSHLAKVIADRVDRDHKPLLGRGVRRLFDTALGDRRLGAATRFSVSFSIALIFVPISFSMG